MMAGTPRVVVFNLARVPVHHGSLAITRTLGRLGAPAIAFLEAVAFSRSQPRPLTCLADGLSADPAHSERNYVPLDCRCDYGASPVERFHAALAAPLMGRE